ncbi:lytic transglycosylase domain-containing protein [Candidatus Uabimicrobium sp. HlEnr_7]|uniref:lytic transglycosylase domain-containing protein n=1 Tax=Candidatus Uabimicrobium helgolandensis TaxID=3095367 RepID=UPI003556CFCB
MISPNNIKFLFVVLFCVSAIIGNFFSPQSNINIHEMWVKKYAREFFIDENLIAAMIMTESSGDVKAVSPKGAQGLMQITPETAKNLCQKLQISFSDDILLQPQQNIFLGCYYIHYLLDSFYGCKILALAAYNCGPNRVKKWLRKTPNISAVAILKTHAPLETKHFVWTVLYRYHNSIR